MADPDKMERTWLCSVLFMDIANYSSQSVEVQIRWKKRFNGYLTDAIREVPESERVILDTGDGAAVCFLGAPEAPMFAALQLARCFALDETEHQPGLRVRLGINLGPVKLVKDINGALNAIGDGINAGQRIMSFASDNQILVSQSFFEVVSRLSDDYKLLFQLKGVETDKHVREHTVYRLTPPGAETAESVVAGSRGRVIAATPKTAAPAGSPTKGPWLPWLVASAALAALAVAGISHFYGSPAPVAQAAPQTQAAPLPASADVKPTAMTGAPASAAPKTAAAASVTTPAEKSTSTATPSAPAATPSSAPLLGAGRRGRGAPPPSTPVSAEAKAAYDDAMRLLQADNAAEAAHRFDDATRAQPDYVDAYLGRAEARRTLLQTDLSLRDCAKVIQLQAADPRGYVCRGLGYQLMKKYDAALPDLTEAIQLDPNLVIAYEHRGAIYDLLQQYDHAVQDYSRAISIAPRTPVFYVRLGTAYSNLKQYDKAIRNYTEAIRLQPELPNAYRLRALAEEASGDLAGAAADRAHLQDAPRKKRRQ